MRLKKLRIFVAIFILTFILVAGNIIAFGLISKQSISPVNTSKELKVTFINSTKENTIAGKKPETTTTQNTVTTTKTQTTSKSATQSQGQVIKSPKRTRAS